MRSAVIATLATGPVIALAFVLNPSREQHRSKIKQAIGERSPLAGALGSRR